MPERQLRATYASPGLRWSLLLTDHPEATYSFEECSGAELAMPRFEDVAFVVCTVNIPGHEPVVAWREIPAQEESWVNNRKTMVPAVITPEKYLALQTKAMGRALKRAGYPDDTQDLRAVMVWRQRLREIELMGTAGVSNTQLTKAADAIAAIEAAAQVGSDDEPASAEERPAERPRTQGQTRTQRQGPAIADWDTRLAKLTVAQRKTLLGYVAEGRGNHFLTRALVAMESGGQTRRGRRDQAPPEEPIAEAEVVEEGPGNQGDPDVPEHEVKALRAWVLGLQADQSHEIEERMATAGLDWGTPMAWDTYQQIQLICDDIVGPAEGEVVQ